MAGVSRTPLDMFCSFVICVKEKTACELSISDWSSDVCSSDLASESGPSREALLARAIGWLVRERRSDTRRQRAQFGFEAVDAPAEPIGFIDFHRIGKVREFAERAPPQARGRRRIGIGSHGQTSLDFDHNLFYMACRRGEVNMLPRDRKGVV